MVGEVLAGLGAILLILFAGSKPVEPWEKERLSEKMMQFVTDQEGSVYQQHMLNAREGSSGGYGGAGGGCGCK